MHFPTARSIPTVDRLLPLDRQTGSVVDIDATFLFGAEIRTAGARPVRARIEVADVPG
jgi:hypothetical protein